MSSEQERPKVAGYDSPRAAQRNRYFRGKLLTVADYTIEQRYHIGRRHLINRTLHGWGVVSGLAVEAKDGVLLVSAGMALDPRGRELVAGEKTILERDTDMVWLSGDARVEPPGERPAEGDATYLLSAHYAERGIDGVRIEDGYGDSICETNRVCETMVFSLTRRPSPPAEPLADAGGRAAEPEQATADFDFREVGKLSRIDGFEIDLDSPVPLALVVVKFGRSAPPRFERIDASDHPRRLARSSPAIAPEETERTRVRTGGGLEMRHVATPEPALSPAKPEEEIKLERMASEAEAALRAAEQAFADAENKADAAGTAASNAEDRLRQATQAHHQADEHLATLRAEAGAVTDKLPQAADVRLEAETDLARLKAQAKAEAEEADDAQRRLDQAKAEREQAEVTRAGLKAALDAAMSEMSHALSLPVLPFGINAGSEREDRIAAAGPRLEQAAAAFRQGEHEVVRLGEAETAAAGARRNAAVTPEMIETAERRVETARKEERELKAAADKGATPKMITTAEERAAAAKQEAQDAQKEARATKEESRLRAEEQAAAQVNRDAARTAWLERARQLAEAGGAGLGPLAGENERSAELARQLEERRQREEKQNAELRQLAAEKERLTELVRQLEERRERENGELAALQPLVGEKARLTEHVEKLENRIAELERDSASRTAGRTPRENENE